uniref:Uncharacterized protein n=1 Tax=Anguilla anguilla TaxID=7936 RepID=A0A0E9WMW4_ANGAN
MKGKFCCASSISLESLQISLQLAGVILSPYEHHNKYPLLAGYLFLPLNVYWLLMRLAT